MKLNTKHVSALGALSLISVAASGASATPKSSPAGFSLDSAELSINLTGKTAEPRWSYPFGVLPQGAIAQPRPVMQNGRVQSTSWSPLSVRPGGTNFVMPAATAQPEPSPLTSLLPTEQAQSTIAISRRAGVGHVKRLKQKVQPEVSAPTPVKSVVVKSVAVKADAVKSTATPKPVLVAVRPPAEITLPATPAGEEAKATPTVAAKTTATPTPLGSRHKDLTLLAQMEADLNRTDRRLKTAEAKLSVGQRVLSKCADTLRQAMMEAGPDARGLHPFVRVAQRYAGTPYVWGGESARGFDCSGFIIRVMRDLGYRSLPHSAAEQFNYGKPIARSLMKPGDLVFFKNTYKPGISHVGIYLGKGRFIHAAGTGKGTIVSSLFDAKWRPGGPHYAGARRLIAARNG